MQISEHMAAWGRNGDFLETIQGIKSNEGSWMNNGFEIS
jgi:hypothetical protein